MRLLKKKLFLSEYYLLLKNISFDISHAPFMHA